MTDRVNSFTVILDQDMRTDDVEAIVDAIRCIKHVVSVQPRISNPDSEIARMRVKTELINKLWDVLK